MLGNPVGLFSSLGSGWVDFFYEPAQGLVKSPKDFGMGLAKVIFLLFLPFIIKYII